MTARERTREAALLERDDELAQLQASVASARDGHGTLLIIRAPAGMGKTRLMQATRDLAADQGFGVVSARGAELERSFAFGVARQLFEPLVLSGVPAERRVAQAGAAANAAPIFDPAAPESLGTTGAAGADPTFRLMYGLYWLTANLAARAPLLVAVDDAHWSDPQSLRWLDYLARRIEELPVVVVVAARPAEPGGETELIDRLSGPGGVVLQPAGLGSESVARLVRDIVGREPDEPFCEACREATGGNPFLLVELLGAVAADEMAPTDEAAPSIERLGPERVSRSVLVRLARAGEAASAIAHAVAVLGRGASIRDAAALAGQDEETALQAADVLASADILAPGLPLDFVHPVVRTAVYRELPAGERALTHQRAARTLAEGGAPAEEVAAHLLRSEGGEEAWAVEQLRRAAAHARARGATDAATDYLRRALEVSTAEDQRIALLRELGADEVRAADPRSVDHLREAMAGTRGGRERGEIAIELGRALMLTGRLAEAIEVFDRASDEVREESPDLAFNLQLELVGAARFDATTQGLVRDRLERMREDSPGAGPAHHRMLANLAFEQIKVPLPVDTLAAMAEDAMAGGELLAAEGIESPVFYLPMFTWVYCDRYERAIEVADEVLAIARRTGSALGYSMASCVRAAAHMRAGSVADAEAHALAALDSQPEVGLSQPLALASLVEACLERGALAEAARYLQDAGLAEEIPNAPLFMPLIELRARTKLARGDLPGAVADFRLAGERGAAWRSRNPTFLPWRTYGAPPLAATGEAEEARRWSDEAVELAREFGAPRTIGMALRGAGLVEGGERGEALLREAVEVLAPSPARLEHARALVDLGAALRRSNRRRAARELLTEGLDVAQRCGGAALAERAREELEASGARPRREMVSGPDALTPSERRVADLAVEGLSNPEIAQALFVTRKTVEMHLGRVYRKLDVHAREELAAVLEPAAT